jgi:hypothetical protein
LLMIFKKLRGEYVLFYSGFFGFVCGFIAHVCGFNTLLEKSGRAESIHTADIFT